MPFKLKLKKSRQYNVSSKNLFVISVELLDNTTVECTLSSHSLGQECLSNVCQRLGLQQPQYFGLRFLSKKGTFWWVDLQRPLKKQLDKYAQESCSLYLGVMYFVSDVNIIHDEVTRYHYFLQLKSDIIEGKLHCSQEQAILFASYSLQAEFGDHDPERHTTEYLKNFVLLPKQMARGKENQEAVLEQVIHTHRSLQGLSQQLAEVYYIMEAQQLEGYGQECFAGKDNTGSTLFVGVSLIGIFIRYMNERPPLCFQWDQIINLVHHKRCFGIECHLNPKVLQFIMEDSHLAKYVWKMCIQQHRFYTKNEGLISPTVSEASGDHRKQSNLNMGNSGKYSSSHNIKERTESKSQLQASQESLDGLGVYHTEGSYSEHMPPTTMYRHMLMEEDRIPEHLRSSQLPLNQSHTPSVQTLHAAYSHPVPLNSLPVSSSATQLSKPDFPSSSSLYQHHHQQQQQLQQQFIQENDLESDVKYSILPSYRQAPDYETAVRLKYGIQNSSAGDLSSSSPVIQSQNAATTGSQINISHAYSQQQMAPLQSYAQYKNYNDLSHIEAGDPPRDGTVNDPVVLARNCEHLSATSLNPPVHTYSTPELASQSLIGDVPSEQSMANLHLLYQYKPPPPYPYKQRSSSSTPDLTRNHQQQLHGNSSPDLVSRKNLGVMSHIGSHMEDQVQGIPAYRLGSEPIIHVNIQNTGNIKNPLQLQNHAQTSLMQTHNAPSANDPSTINSANIVNSNITNHHNLPSQNVNMQSSHLGQSYQNCSASPLQVSIIESTAHHIEPATSTALVGKRTEMPYSEHSPQALTAATQAASLSTGVPIQLSNWNEGSHQEIALYTKVSEETLQRNVIDAQCQQDEISQTMGPMLVAAMNGLTLSKPDVVAPQEEETRFPKDARIQMLESRLAEGQVFLEFEQIVKKKPMADFTAAVMPENISRNRFKDVFPYEDNRVRLTPTKENRTGYINASHVSVTVGGAQRFYIAAQGPLPNTLYSFWQMIWEHHISVIVMLTEVQEQGRDKCFPYWPQEESNKLQIGEFQIIRNFSMSSPTYVTCSLTLCHITSRQQRPVWHIQYTDWPDHSCPQDIQGFITFMGEVDAVRRLALSQQPPGRGRTAPIVVHCSAGVGRSGVVILCDIMLYALDHNQPIDIPKVLTQLRLQRMLTIQTLAQYKFVYTVLILYLKNSRLI